MAARLDRLDRVALGAIAGLSVLIGVILIRGDQAGVQIAGSTPRAGAEGVASRARVSFTFSEAMNPSTLNGRIRINPPVSGTLSWNGATASFAPAHPLQHDTLYTVTVRAGASSARGRLMLRDASWTFRTGHPRVVYLSPALEAGDLYVAEIDPAVQPSRITSETYGVFDFAVSPDGTRIAYSANRDGTGQRDLWLIDAGDANREPLAACDDQVCQSPSWSADGTRVAFERRAFIESAVGRSPGPSRIWLIDAASKAAEPLFSDSQKLGTLPRWAPVGEKLSYYDPLETAVVVLDVATGGQVLLPSALGDSGTWSPDATQLIYVDLEISEAGQFSQMFHADLVTNSISPVKGMTATNDSSPAWSPSGGWIAFSQQQMVRPRTGAAVAFGPQVWVSTPEGADARPLTDEPEYSHGGLSWSPDEVWLAAVRNNLRTPNSRPEVRLVRADGGEGRLLAADATIPAWVP
jgi:Tol biopolymer transport system component